jgi:hypothetical protein
MSISFSTPVTSFGGYFTYAEPLTLAAFGLLSNEVVAATSLFSNNEALSGDPGSSPNEFLLVTFAAGISSVRITGNPAGGSFTLDESTYTSGAPAVPEPSPLGMCTIGLGVMLAFPLLRAKIINPSCSKSVWLVRISQLTHRFRSPGFLILLLTSILFAQAPLVGPPGAKPAAIP